MTAVIIEAMVALKANDVDSFVARPSPERPVVLLCGPDAGLVHERAEKIRSEERRVGKECRL